MAYQPKSYRKFAATAATATLVATAVTPAFAAENLPFGDVNQNYAEAVGALYSKGIVNGVSKTEFGTYQSLKRGDAAVIIARALELDTKNAPDAGFKDVNSNIKGAVNALVAKGIINGVSKDKFDPDAPLTRGAMAKILVNAYNLKDYAKETPFTDLTSTFKPYVEALYGAGITKGKGSTYGTNEKITRGDFANMLYKAMNVKPVVAESIKPIDDITVDEGTKLEDVKLPEKVTVVYSDKSEKEASVKWDTSKLDLSKPDTYKLEGTVDGTELKASVNVVVKAVAPKVESVKATNPTTVEITGTGLENLKAEDFSLDGNKVTSYNVNPETGVATLTFENKFESGKEQTLKLTEKVEGQEDKVSEFKFTYNLEIKSVVANALTVDNDTAGQKLTFKINDEATDADLDYIKASGYNVEFQATNAVFTGSSSSSTTGELASSLTPDKTFEYKVVITDKDGNVVAESPLAEVKVVDKSNVVAAIDNYDLVKDNGDSTTTKLTSNTVVLGENVSIANVIGDKEDGTKDTDITSLVEFTSSNKDVALVDSTGHILPIKPGTTTITVKAGDVSKSFVLTVASEARVPKTATLTTPSLKLVESGSDASIGVVVKDQYGDAVSGLDLAKDVTYEPTQVTVNGVATNIVNVAGSGATDAEGKASLTVTPVAAGTGSVKVKVGNNVIATFNVSVSKDITVATHKLELLDASKDTKLDIYTGEVDDKSVAFAYNKYNADGFLLGAETDIDTNPGSKYTVSVEEPSGKDVIDASVADGVITVTAKADAGTAYLVIKEGSVVREKLPITVVNSTPTVSAITLKSADKVTKATNITADSVLTLKDDKSGKDKAVQNITLTTASSKEVRLDETSGKLYLDTNNSGTYDPGELVVGTVSITENISGSATGTSIATNLGDKGSVVYSVKDTSDKVIATSVIDVDVPAAN